MSVVRRTLTLAAAATMTLACGEIVRDPAAKPKPASQVFERTPANRDVELEPVVLSADPSQSGHAPNLGGGPLFSNAGSFNLGMTSPGSADFVAAPVIDFLGSTGPSTLGTGGWTNIVAGGTTFSSAMAESIAGVLPDDRGIDYLLLNAYTEETDPLTGATIGTVMYAIVLASDFSVGGSVNLDGFDRLAIFARGDINLPDPQLAAAAVTGTITFSAGGLAIGDQITASLTGDFGEFTWTSSITPPGGGMLTPGNYNITYDPAPNVSCDGTLAGQEAQFASITAASIGFTNGPVTLANSALPGNFDISGAPITSGYGVATLTLEAFPDAPPGVVGGFTNSTGASGPAGTTYAGAYLVIDGTTATATDVLGWSGGGYLTPTQDGFCSVDFLVTLGP